MILTVSLSSQTVPNTNNLKTCYIEINDLTLDETARLLDKKLIKIDGIQFASIKIGEKSYLAIEDDFDISLLEEKLLGYNISLNNYSFETFDKEVYLSEYLNYRNSGTKKELNNQPSFINSGNTLRDQENYNLAKKLYLEINQ